MLTCAIGERQVVCASNKEMKNEEGDVYGVLTMRNSEPPHSMAQRKFAALGQLEE